MKKNPLFNKIRINKPQSSLFDLSHEKKLSLNMGYLVPIMVSEILPGDRFKVSTEMLMRLAPMVSPVMHRINAIVDTFYVPKRLVYDDWQKFITGGATGNEVPAFPKFYVEDTTASKFQLGSLGDYFGIPVPQATGNMIGLEVSALPFRAYQLIWNEYYRDQNLQAELAINKTGTIVPGELDIITQIRKRAWEKDYFTSALPFPQRGSDVLIPGEIDYSGTSSAWTASGEIGATAGNVTVLADGTVAIPHQGGQAGRIETPGQFNSTINDLRQAVRLQEWFEKNARAGSRYIEQILSHFGVRSSDARLQRPEMISSSKWPVQISEVLSTVGTTDAPQGNMSGHGLTVGQSGGWSRRFEEHGYVFMLLSVLPRTTYQQGCPKQFCKFDKFDYAWPSFAHLGEQEIKLKEIYVPYEFGGNPENLFGYTPRYAEYKFINDSVHGDFRTTLSHWHMGRQFDGTPALNEAFITADPTHRIFADTVETDHKLYCQIYNHVKAVRPLPFFGTPRL